MNDLCSMLIMDSTKLIRANAGSLNTVVFFLDAFEHIIINDTVCTLEDWNKIEVACAENKHEKLSQKIVLILTSQDGVFENSPLDEKRWKVNGTCFVVVFLCNSRGSSYSSQAKNPFHSLYEP